MRSFKISFSIVLFFFSSLAVQAQETGRELKANIEFLKQNTKDLDKVFKNKQKEIKNLAKKKGWIIVGRTKGGHLIQLVDIDDFGLPIYESTENEVAAGTTRVAQLRINGSLGLNLNGSTMPLGSVAVWDGGSALATHQEFMGGRIVVKDGSANDSHATHVSGTIAASGVYAPAKGMAYALPNLLSYNNSNDNSEMSGVAQNLLLSNHSYGVIAGWRRNDTQGNRWEWMGRYGDTEDYKFGYYDSKAQTWDQICFNAPYYLPVKSGGNYRSQTGPAVGETYWGYNASGVMSNLGARPSGISSNDGYGIVGTYGVAKNILTVGAINGLPYGSASPSDIGISSFSAWGPTDDGRIKPDLVADGVNLTSSTNTGNDNYAVMSGTSMAAPNATGSLVLLQELYKQKTGNFMRSATLKGLAIATTSEAGANPGPDYIYGWGLLNVEKAAKAILQKGDKSVISENILNNGQTQTMQVVASGFGPLVATICWTDPPATPVSSSLALNNSSLRLVNDLDMRITNATTTYYPWVLDPLNPTAAATTEDNFRDNMEQVFIANAVPGEVYTIRINHKNSLMSGNPQAYSLIVTGVGGSPYCLSGPSSTSDSKINGFQLSNINYTATSGCTSYSDMTNQTIQLEKGKTYSFTLSLGTCLLYQDKMAKIFVDWNGDNDFDHADELVATSGVIAGDGSFTSSIVVPNGVVIGNYSRLRVVLVETADANNVLACGTYTKGETMDFRVEFLESTINAGIIDIVNPIDGEKAESGKNIGIRVKNFGVSTLTDIPLQIIIRENGSVINTYNEILYGDLASKAEREFLLQSTFTAQEGKSYQIQVKTNVTNDTNPADDSFSKTVSFTPKLSIPIAKALRTDVTGAYYLETKQSEGLPFWFDRNATLTAFSNQTSLITNKAPTDGTTYYLGVNNSLPNFGPATKATFGGGTYTQPPYLIYINTTSAMVIESARLYIGYPGTITFNVFDVNNGVKVSSSTISVTNTRSSASTSTSAANDTYDLGKVYNLNIKFPYTGNFYLTATFDSGATIFRSNSVATGNLNYPLTDNLGLFSIVSHTGSTTSMNSFWYMFYEMRIKPLGEELAVKQPIYLSDLMIDKQADKLISPFVSGNQWYKDDVQISGANSQSYLASTIGTYKVKVDLGGGITITSQPIQLNSLPVTIKNFSAQKQNNGVRLNWSIETSNNHDKFIIEKANDGVTFKVLTTNNELSLSYSYLDERPFIGLNYYRLKQIDKDGKVETFGPILVNYDLISNDFMVYENPVKEKMTVKFLSAKLTYNYQIVITDVLGKTIKSIQLTAQELINAKKLDVGHLTNGLYQVSLIELNSGRQIGIAKVIKL